MSDYPHIDEAIEALMIWAFLGVMLTVIASISTYGLLIAIIVYAGMTCLGFMAVFNAFEDAKAALSIFSGLQVVFVLCIAFGGITEIIWGGVMLGILLDLIALFSA
jgi:hypothetical protein